VAIDFSVGDFGSDISVDYADDYCDVFDNAMAMTRMTGDMSLSGGDGDALMLSMSCSIM